MLIIWNCRDGAPFKVDRTCVLTELQSHLWTLYLSFGTNTLRAPTWVTCLRMSLLLRAAPHPWCWLISYPVSCTTALVHFTLQNALLLCVDIKMCVQNLDVLSSLIVGDFIHLFRNAFAITGHRHSTESVMRRYVYIVFHDVGLKYNFGLSVPPFVW